jgi:hypothetical protein
LVLLACAVAIASASTIACASTFPSSPFVEARYPASELDLILRRASELWLRQVVREPSDEFASQHPLLVAAGVAVDFSYLGGDVISASAVITDINGFLGMTVDERKKLVHDILDYARMLLWLDVRVYESPQAKTWTRLSDRHIELGVMIARILTVDKGKNIRIASFPAIDVGQAAYRGGAFVYSRAYFLDLQVVNDRAVSGDASELVFERQ